MEIYVHRDERRDGDPVAFRAGMRAGATSSNGNAGRHGDRVGRAKYVCWKRRMGSAFGVPMLLPYDIASSVHGGPNRTRVIARLASNLGRPVADCNAQKRPDALCVVIANRFQGLASFELYVRR